MTQHSLSLDEITQNWFPPSGRSWENERIYRLRTPRGQYSARIIQKNQKLVNAGFPDTSSPITLGKNGLVMDGVLRIIVAMDDPPPFLRVELI